MGEEGAREGEKSWGKKRKKKQEEEGRSEETVTSEASIDSTSEVASPQVQVLVWCGCGVVLSYLVVLILCGIGGGSSGDSGGGSGGLC